MQADWYDRVERLRSLERGNPPRGFPFTVNWCNARRLLERAQDQPTDFPGNYTTLCCTYDQISLFRIRRRVKFLTNRASKILA